MAAGDIDFTTHGTNLDLPYLFTYGHTYMQTYTYEGRQGEAHLYCE